MNVYKNNTAYCCKISVSRQVTYFPINRLADWKNVSYRLFDTTALGLIYTLAALFTVVSLVAGIRLVFVIKELVMRVTALKQEHIVVIFIFMFNFGKLIILLEFFFCDKFTLNFKEKNTETNSH